MISVPSSVSIEFDFLSDLWSKTESHQLLFLHNFSWNFPSIPTEEKMQKQSR